MTFCGFHTGWLIIFGSVGATVQNLNWGSDSDSTQQTTSLQHNKNVGIKRFDKRIKDLHVVAPWNCPTHRLLFLDVCTQFTCTSVVTVGGKACGINPLQQMDTDGSREPDTRRLYLPVRANVSTWKHGPAHALRRAPGRTRAPHRSRIHIKFQNPWLPVVPFYYYYYLIFPIMPVVMILIINLSYKWETSLLFVAAVCISLSLFCAT